MGEPAMKTLRPRDARGHADHGWLDSWHTFSFADYHDPRHMGFRALRVLNEDRVAAGSGFGMHPHREMEIVSYVLEGELEHRDSTGHRAVIRPGDVQRMTAGTGIVHSERNPSATKPVHFLQIWLLPSERGLAPSYEQRTFAAESLAGRLTVVASPDGRDGSLVLRTAATLLAGRLDEERSVSQAIARNQSAWVQLARGTARVNGVALAAGDGLALTDEAELVVEAARQAEVLAFLLD